MNSLPILHDGDYLSIDNLGRETQEQIRAIIELSGVVHWHNRGEVRTIPLAILMDTFETYDFWESAPDKWQVHAPEAVGRIYWADTQPIPQMQQEL